MLPSDVNTTFMYPEAEITFCGVKYIPESSARSSCCEQTISVHWNTRTKSLPGWVLNSVKVMPIYNIPPNGAIIHVQFALLG
jgi:hypothetical protein